MVQLETLTGFSADELYEILIYSLFGSLLRAEAEEILKNFESGSGCGAGGGEDGITVLILLEPEKSRKDLFSLMTPNSALGLGGVANGPAGEMPDEKLATATTTITNATSISVA